MTANPWELLFPPRNDSGGCTLQLRLMRKHGEPLLLLPARYPATAAALDLYPAQSAKARLARAALALLQRFSLQPGTTPVTLRLDSDSRFVKFLIPSGSCLDEITLAILLGNPRTAGRRFVLLVFNRDGQPVRVVKAGGGGDRALELLRREMQFLKLHPSALLRCPELQDTFDAPSLAALALDYVPGPTPAAADTSSVPEILESWLSEEPVLRFGKLPAARRLADSARTDDATRRALEQLNEVRVRPAIHHGDFAPWNIRVNSTTRRWVVLDWERGETNGPPAWDWFHYVIQPEVLVCRAGAEAVVARVEQLRRDPAFLRYVTLAGISDNVPALLLGYAIHCRDISRQTEGMATICALIDHLHLKGCKS